MSNEIEFKLADVWDVLSKYYYMICGCTVLFALIAFICNQYLFDEIYASSTTLYTWNSYANGTQIDSSTANRDIVFYNRLVNDYKQLIESRRVNDAVKKILKEHTAGALPDYSIEVKLKRNTRMITIKAQSTNAKIACLAANTTAQVFIDTIKTMMDMNNIKIIDKAYVSKCPVKPNKVRNIFIFAILGMLVGFGIGFLLKIVDNTVKSMSDATNYFQLPAMGIIPEVIASNKKTGQANCGVTIINSENANKSHFVEAFRVIRNNIEYTSPDNPLKVVMSSSAMPNAGKTTLTCNLASSFALSGKKVLIVDCDLRKPTIHSVFKINNSLGVVNYLIHKATLEECIQKNVINGVDVISAGAIPPNPSELLMSETFQTMIADLRSKYDYIFLDAPPATINLADAAIVGRIADGSLFVLRANYCKYDVAKHAMEQLLQVNGNKIIGLVLNRFDFKHTPYYSETS